MRLAPEVAIERLPREPAPAKSAGERPGEDKPAEVIPKRHETIPCDHEMSHRVAIEEQDPPRRRARREALTEAALTRRWGAPKKSSPPASDGGSGGPQIGTQEKTPS